MPYVKMQQILEANTTIGRKKMSFEAGVSDARFVKSTHAQHCSLQIRIG